MPAQYDFAVNLSDIDKSDVHYVGGKNANLGEMIQAGFPVPEGFAVTTNAYYEFLKENDLSTKIKHLVGTINFDDNESLTQVSSHIRSLIKKSAISKRVADEIFSHYKKMEERLDAPFVAIRSSATSEDSKTASFAGQQESYLNVRGEAAVLDTVREAWASLFKARAMFYRHDAKLDQVRTGISLVVQKMIQSDTSGVMFTADPITGNRERIVIEAIYGLGEYIVQGRVTPDRYELNKSDLKIVLKKISQQQIKLEYKNGENERIMVKKNIQGDQKISDDVIEQLADLAKKIESHYYFPQDIEWAVENGKVYIVQTRPITTLSVKSKKTKDVPAAKSNAPQKTILIGDAASPGFGIGRVKIVRSLKDLSKVEKGDVLVALMTNPDYVPVMRKVSGIVTERGGRTSHAAIVSREFGIPAIVGATGAMQRLKENQIVTINGAKGEVYEGSIAIEEEASEFRNLRTATNIYVNLSEPGRAREVAALNVDGVGLLRAEFMIAQIGIHPKKLIEEGRQKFFIEKLANSLEAICSAFYPRPIIYRTTDFKTNEYRNLVGGKHYEPIESNPMLGYRGAYRYINDERVFNLELDAIKYVRENKGFSNLNVMLPFVRTLEELKKVKSLIYKAGLRRSNLFKIYMMVEIPSNVILIDKFIEEGLDGVSIGSNDLTMLTLGIDRDNEEVAREFNERDGALMWAYTRVIKSANKNRISSSICGQSVSFFPDLTEKLVRLGITSVSVSPDAVGHTREIVHRAEKDIMKGKNG